MRIILGMSGLTVWSINKCNPYLDMDLLGIVPAEPRSWEDSAAQIPWFSSLRVPQDAERSVRDEGSGAGMIQEWFPAVPA